jgi:hypothetical protein
LQPGGQFESFHTDASMEGMTIKCSDAGCVLEQPWEGGAAIIFSGENRRMFWWGGGGRKEVAICSRAIKFDCSAQLPTSLTLQSNGNDVGDSDGSDGYDDEGGRRATATTTRVMATATSWRAAKRAMVRAARAMATAMRVAGNKEGKGDGDKGGG